MREKIKEIFLESNNQFISGEDISKRLDISRTAVWKQIEKLKEEGYQFEAVRKKGYRLLNNPDDLSPKIIINKLKTNWLGQNIIYYKEIESTQKESHELAKRYFTNGTVVIADRQTNGKGRLGRTWHSEKGKGLWFSIILRPEFGYQQAPLITLYTSIMIIRTLEKLYKIGLNIKWPNDIYYDNKKIAGILTELHGEQDKIDYLIIGIGINTHITEYPIAIKDKATSIESIIKEEPNRVQIITKLLDEFEQNFNNFNDTGFDSFYDEYNKALLWKDKRVTIRNLSNTYDGQLVGIDHNGYLCIRTDTDNSVKVISGDIEFL